MSFRDDKYIISEYYHFSDKVAEIGDTRKFRLFHVSFFSYLHLVLHYMYFQVFSKRLEEQKYFKISFLKNWDLFLKWLETRLGDLEKFKHLTKQTTKVRIDRYCR